MQNPSHITVMKGAHKGQNVAIIGSIHGNERLGAGIIAELEKRMQPEKIHGTLTLILGNPEAYVKNTRFIDCDLNRLFGSGAFEKILTKATETLHTEEKRACEIAPFLKKTDYLLDIHSTIKPSVPFVYCENTKKHLELAQLFETAYIVSPDPRLDVLDLQQCTDNFVNSRGGIGITYEGGWHQKPLDFTKTLEKTIHFLEYVGLLVQKNATKKPYSGTQLILYKQLLPQTASFSFTRDFVNFDQIAAGEIIANDGGKPLKATQNSFIIFPKIEITVGKPAGYLATSFSPLS